MKVSLRVTSGTESGRRIDLRDGQVAQFGRTEWADFAFAADASMADVHFVVECGRDACRLRAVATDRETSVNGQKTAAAVLHTGDVIKAGRTTFNVAVEGEVFQTGDGAVAQVADEPPPPPPDYVELCKYLDLDDALPEAQAAAGQPPDDLLARLVKAKKFTSAARFYAHFLPKRAAVWWGCLAVREACGPLPDAEQVAALESAEQWVAEQDEPSRRRTEVAFEKAKYSGPGGMLAAAAFGAGHSLAPPESSEPVPPDPRMTGQFVKIALVFASVAGDARQAPVRWPRFVALAQEVLTGKIKLPGEA